MAGHLCDGARARPRRWWRPGLGLTADGKSLLAHTLALALQSAGAVYAMQLDVNSAWVVFATYEVRNPDADPPTLLGHKLMKGMGGPNGLFMYPYQRDFIYLVRREAPLERAVR